MQQDLLPLCANQLSSSAYVSTTAFPIIQCNLYPTQTQSEYSGQYSHTPQQYMLNMNYAAPPCDVVEYPVSNDILLHTAEH